MKIRYGLISADSHAQLDREAFVSRMSRSRWGDRIPRVIETTDRKHMAAPENRPVERWMIDGRVNEVRGASNCPAVMNDPARKTYPQRWEDVPRGVYDPHE